MVAAQALFPGFLASRNGHVISSTNEKGAKVGCNFEAKVLGSSFPSAASPNNQLDADNCNDEVPLGDDAVKKKKKRKRKRNETESLNPIMRESCPMARDIQKHHCSRC